jgi:hypothetical protein
MGLVALVERYALPRRTVVLAGAVALAAVIGGFGLMRVWNAPLLWISELHLPGDRMIIEPAVLFAVLALLGLAGWRWAVRRRVPPGTGPVLLLAAVLFAGLPALVSDARNAHWGERDVWYVAVTGDQAGAARWVREHTSPDDVLATNEHCAQGVETDEPGCLSLSFWLPAYSERRLLVGSWGYAPRLTSSNAGYNGAFWDPALLAENDAAFTAPTADGLRRLRTVHNVRLLVVNRTVGPESPRLRELATLRLEQGPIAIYELDT